MSKSSKLDRRSRPRRAHRRTRPPAALRRALAAEAAERAEPAHLVVLLPLLGVAQDVVTPPRSP